MTVTRRTSSFSDKLFGRPSPSTTLNSTDGTPTTNTHIPDPKPYGIKVLSHPPREDPVADILFVHGIKGHRENTWAQGHGGRPWPQTLLPLHLPNVRILTFGYDANPIAWRASVSVNRIGDHSKNLLAALAAHRENTSRPIIIVAHSLGGLVCKDALITSRSSADERIRRIYDCTRGVVFLGTPHTGASLATAANRLARVLALTTSKSNLRILRVLERNSEVLVRIQADFYMLLQASTFQVTCFYEELKYPGIGDVIVSADSAVLPGYMGIGIHAHHKDIARFADENSPGFDSVLGELQRWVADTTYGGEFTTSGPNKRNFIGSNATGRTVGGCNGSGIEIWGDVIRSNVVNGSQTVHGNITFSGS